MNDSNNFQFSWAYLTDTGIKRTSNEDSALGLVLNVDAYQECGTIGLFVVSDGMGGKELGELASKIAIKTVADTFTRTILKCSLGKVPEISNYGTNCEEEQELVASPARFLTDSIQEANRRIFHLKRGGDRIKVGATITAAVLTDNLLTIGHVGDCRCYVLFEGALRQLTRDHTMVNELIKQGILSPEEGKNHPQRNILARALGSHETVEVDTAVSVVDAGCKIMLCTDGLHAMVGGEDIQAALGAPGHPKQLAGSLVEQANRAGGKDNVTVMVIQIN